MTMRPLANTATILLIATLALAAMPGAHAQAASSAAQLTLDIRPLDMAIDPTTGAYQPALVELTRDAVSAAADVNGVRVDLEIVSAPEWATVTLSPTSIVLQSYGPTLATSQQTIGEFSVVIHVARDAPAYVWETIEIAAYSEHTPLSGGAMATALLPIAAAIAPECHHEDEHAAAADAEREVTVQSAAATPLANATPLALAALGAVAVAGGAYALRRFR